MDGFPGRGLMGRRHVIVGLLAVTWFVVATPVVRTSVLRPAIVVPAAVLLPGYALVSALAPASDVEAPLEELAVEALFAAATGLSTVVLLGVALAFAPVGITVWTTLGGVTAVTVVGVSVDAYRTRNLTGEDPAPTDGGSPAASVAPSDLPVARAVGAVVLLAGVVGLGASAYLVALHDQPGYAALEASPVEGAPNGSAVAGEPLEITLENARSSARTYTVVASVERVGGDDGEALERREVERFTVELDADESWTERHVPPTPWDGPTRAVYGLYRGSESTGSSDARVHRWLERGNADEGAGEP